jgi:hypothetical protein
MEDADNGNPVRHLTIKQEMRPSRKLAIAQSDLIAFTPFERICCYRLDGRLQFADVTLGLAATPLFGAVVPDFVEIDPGTG